jgi:hypothetical protein
MPASCSISDETSMRVVDVNLSDVLLASMWSVP